MLIIIIFNNSFYFYEVIVNMTDTVHRAFNLFRSILIFSFSFLCRKGIVNVIIIIKRKRLKALLQVNWNDPLWPSSKPNWRGGQQDQGHLVVLHDQGEGYHVNHANTERYRNSSIPFLQRKLNENRKIERKRLKALLQVNCVSYVDPITSWK